MLPKKLEYDILKEEVRKKFGKPILYSKDCNALSESIDQYANRQVSPSTLKRFFEIIPNRFNPSKYTLDSLSIYAGFSDWNHFKEREKLPNDMYSPDCNWEKFQQFTKRITEYSLESIKNQIGIPYKYNINRKFAEEKFNAFLSSDMSATAFIAPAGYGKSIMISKLTEKFFLDEHASYPTDIVTLIDGSKIPDLLVSNFNEKDFISEIFNHQTPKAYQKYLESGAIMEGRFVLIIDNICQLSGTHYKVDQIETDQYLDSIIRILISFAKYKWLKLILSCNTDIWKVIAHKMKQVPGLRDRWFDVKWEGSYHELVNVPILNSKEINQIIRKKDPDDSYEKLQIFYPDLADIIHFPFFLQYYLTYEYDDKSKYEIDLLNQYTQENIFAGFYAKEKYSLIDTFITKSQYGRKRDSVKRSAIRIDDKNRTAYNELISLGILFEFNIIDKYLTVSTCIDFTNDVLFEFLLINYWLRSYDFNYRLFEMILEFYQDNIPLQCKMLKWLIKFAFREEKIELLEKIFKLLKDYSIPSIDNYFLNLHTYNYLNLLGSELETQDKARRILKPHFVSTKIGQGLAFERFIDLDFLVLHYADNIEHYLRYRKDDSEKIVVHYLKFMRYLLILDFNGCTREYDLLMNIKMPLDLTPLSTGPFLFSKIIHKSLIEKQPDDLVMNEIYTIEKKLKKIQKKDDNYPFYQTIVIEALFLCERHTDIINYLETQWFHAPMDNWDRMNRFHQLTLSLYANALLLSGDADKGKEFFDSVSLPSLSINSKYYSKILYNLVKINFLMHEGNSEEATDLLDWILTVSKILKFKFFEEKALKIQGELVSNEI